MSLTQGDVVTVHTCPACDDPALDFLPAADDEVGLFTCNSCGFEIEAVR